jgi:hypothetical protein
LKALQIGISRREEQRESEALRWTVYFALATICQGSLSAVETRTAFTEEFLLPILHQYITPKPESANWVRASELSPSNCVEAVIQAFKLAPEATSQGLETTSKSLIQSIQTSLPEQSKQYQESQNKVVAHVKRWFSLQESLLQNLQSKYAPDLLSLFSIYTLEGIRASEDVLVSRNGKPFSAAAYISFAASICPKTSLDQDETRELLVEFVEKNALVLSISPRHGRANSMAT